MYETIMTKATKVHTYQEGEVFKRLAEPENPRGFFIEVVDMLEDGIDIMMRHAFRQEEYAVKYAIEPLLNGKGPLADIRVRLKLIFALGLISLELSQDIERYIQIRDFLLNDIHDYRFGDDAVRSRIDCLHGMHHVSMLNVDDVIQKGDPYLYEMQMNRRDQIIRSALLLTVADMMEKLTSGSPI